LGKEEGGEIIGYYGGIFPFSFIVKMMEFLVYCREKQYSPSFPHSL
jgi:hypothetical protein